MNKIRFSLLIVATVLILTIYNFLNETKTVFYSDQSIDGVRNTFHQYREALLKRAGNKAADYLDSYTVKWFEELAHVERIGDGLKSQFLSNLEKNGHSKYDLKHMTGKQIYAHLFDNHGVDTNSLLTMNFDHLQIDGNRAYGFVTSISKTVPIFDFVYEDGHWKVSLMRTLNELEKEYKSK